MRSAISANFGVIADPQAEALVLAYLAEQARSLDWNAPSPEESPAIRAILEAETGLQIPLLEATFALMKRRLDYERYGSGSSIRVQRLASRLLRRPLTCTDAELCHLLARLGGRGNQDWPWLGFLRSVQRYVAEQGLSPELHDALRRLRGNRGWRQGHAADLKALALLDELLGQKAPEPENPVERGDDWGQVAWAALAGMAAEDRAAWLAFLRFALTASGSKPSGRWLKAARASIEALGERRFRELAVNWLGLLGESPRNSKGERRDGLRLEVSVLERNATLLQGLAWCCPLVEDEALTRALGEAAAICLKKIPFVGARSHRVGNACLYALGATASLRAVAELQRLQQRVKYPTAQRLIDAALEDAARRCGLDRSDLEELAVPDFGLDDGRLRIQIGEYRAEVVVQGAQSVELGWLDPDGTPRRAEPADLKRTRPDELKALKETLDDLRKALPAQRERLERLLLVEREWLLPVWRERYLDHPLLAVFARRLIWRFESVGRAEVGAWLDGVIVGADDRPLEGLSDETRVRLWHPLSAEPGTVLAWRDWLERHAVSQPFKQAHREVYLLTDAERETEVYSNRFAAHILRQHQLQALCQQRGWRYRLQGDFDGCNTPTLDLPRWGMQAEFWVEIVPDGGARSDSGIALYVTSDQVRFSRADRDEPVALAEVPPLLFSELMRDVDLFVGVCSVGNDPTWRDQGLEGHREYWEGFAFGDLSATARTRRAVLERLLPRLKIAERCALEERFLVVRGDLRTYRIHLGSGNILMEPNNQYLCIVRKRGDEQRSEHLFLPFEGDEVLATILSKAFLLADDRAIKDPTISRQIGRR